MAEALRVVLRDAARRDVEDAVDWYREHANADVAMRFVDALAAALRHIGLHPATGSPRYAVELDLPGRRAWRLDGFPYVVCYVERSDHLDVWRLLHLHRDIPAWLHDPRG